MDSELAPQDRPAFPEDAVTWLLGAGERTVVVLSDSQLASAFADYGHDVTNLEGLDGLEGGAEEFPQPSRSVDAVIASRRVPDNLDEVARILRPGGLLALVCNERDQRIPWARKLDAVLKAEPVGDEPAAGIVNSILFGFVSEQDFRFWQWVNHKSLESLVRAELAGREDLESIVEQALALYADYGRGADGMQLPWLSRCFKATVVENAWAPPHGIDEQRRSRSDAGDRDGPDDRDSGEGDPGTSDSDGADPGRGGSGSGSDGRSSDGGSSDGGSTDGSGSGRDDGPPPQDGSDSDLLLIDFR